MNRLLTLTSGGIFATMAILPIVAFAQTDAKTTAPVTAQVETPKAETPKAGATDTKLPAHESKTMASTKHAATTETQKPVAHSGVQAKVTDQNKS